MVLPSAAVSAAWETRPSTSDWISEKAGFSDFWTRSKRDPRRTEGKGIPFGESADIVPPHLDHFSLIFFDKRKKKLLSESSLTTPFPYVFVNLLMVSKVLMGKAPDGSQMIRQKGKAL